MDKLDLSVVVKILLCIFLISLYPVNADSGLNSAFESEELKNMDENTWRFPGEFEEQEAVWIGWLSKEYIKGYKTDDTFLEIVKELQPYVNVVVCVQDQEQQDHVQQILDKNGVPKEGISFYQQKFTMPYWRDFGPIFTIDDNGGKKIADFGFNSWGYCSQTNLQSRMLERIDRDVASHKGIESVMTRVVSEGGDRELNGKGTIMTTEACEFQRNPNMAREEIEEEFKRLLGVSNVIWLKHGTVEDDPYDTTTIPGPDGVGVAYRSASANNHVDEYCRFVSSDTILLAEVSEEEAQNDPVAAENRRRMEENYEILQNSVDQDGNPFNIVRMPIPDMIYFKAEPDDEANINLAQYFNSRDGTAFPIGETVDIVPALSYCNFLISNGVIIGQKYWDEDLNLPESVRLKDEKAKRTLESVFPDRKVIMINPTAVNFGGGGVHCSTQQEPKV